jgi:NAD-reducing hydrogenase small subunit
VKPKLATIWLDGCSGCHMSLLDIDERLLVLAEKVEVVWGPLVDMKKFPDHVDVTLVEGAVSSEEDLHRIRMVRERSRLVVALGDCAVTGNVPAMRNPFTTQSVLERAYIENAATTPCIPDQVVPRLRPHACPVHELVKVDVFVPGCPPSADDIFHVITELLEGRLPDLAGRARFG